jgi:hypothetical protein
VNRVDLSKVGTHQPGLVVRLRKRREYEFEGISRDTKERSHGDVWEGDKNMILN